MSVICYNSFLQLICIQSAGKKFNNGMELLVCINDFVSNTLPRGNFHFFSIVYRSKQNITKSIVKSDFDLYVEYFRNSFYCIVSNTIIKKICWDKFAEAKEGYHHFVIIVNAYLNASTVRQSDSNAKRANYLILPFFLSLQFYTCNNNQFLNICALS